MMKGVVVQVEALGATRLVWKNKPRIWKELAVLYQGDGGIGHEAFGVSPLHIWEADRTLEGLGFGQ